MSNKRKVGETSPELATFNSKKEKNMSQLVGSMSIQELRQMFDLKLKDVATKDDIVGLRSEIIEVKTENEKLKESLISLNTKCISLQNEINQIKTSANAANLVFRLKKSSNDPLIETENICKTLSESQDIITIQDIREISSANGTVTTLAEFKNKNNAFKVLRNAKRLKGTGASVSRDYPPAIRQKRSKLLQLRKHIQTTQPRMKVSLRDDRLSINNIIVEWIDNQGFVTNQVDGFKKLIEDNNLEKNFFHQICLQIQQNSRRDVRLNVIHQETSVGQSTSSAGNTMQISSWDSGVNTSAHSNLKNNIMN